VDNFEAQVRRARTALMFTVPEDHMVTLVDEGCTPSDAFLIIRAALI